MDKQVIKIILKALTILIILLITFMSAKSFKEQNNLLLETDNDKPIFKEENKGQEITKEEYIFKEDLLKLNYSINEIEQIEQKIQDNDVRNYILNAAKYDNLTDFASSVYFDIKNINRYQNYYKNNPSYTTEQVVLHTELGLDNKFYSNIQPTDTSKGILMLVNKYNKLDKNFEYNLVNVDTSYGKGKMNKEAYEYFIKMVDNAKKDNIKLKGISIYRSYNTQNTIYNNYKKNDPKNVDTYSAAPGHSEHQTGLAVDINTASSSAHFENTKEYKWLITNSFKYGFILRYPKDKTYITGYKYEPWHFRYIGIEDATKLTEYNLTFEEYLFKYKK